MGICIVCTDTDKGRLVLQTHHCCYFSFSVGLDAGQHERRQEEEQGAGSSVNQVLQANNNTQHNNLDACAYVS